jgi:NADPH2:quinone reductase
MTVKEVPDPVPGDGEVLIGVHAVGVNYSDLPPIEGKYPSTPARC